MWMSLSSFKLVFVLIQCYCAVWGWGSLPQMEAATLKAAMCLTHKTTHLSNICTIGHWLRWNHENKIGSGLTLFKSIKLYFGNINEQPQFQSLPPLWLHKCLSPRPRLLWHNHTECLELYCVFFLIDLGVWFLMLLSTLYESILKATKQEQPASDSDNWK